MEEVPLWPNPSTGDQVAKDMRARKAWQGSMGKFCFQFCWEIGWLEIRLRL